MPGTMQLGEGRLVATPALGSVVCPIIFPVDSGTQASRCVPSCLWRPLRVSWRLRLRGLPNYM